MMKMNVLIVAGGQGERLWPASTRLKPKQFLPLLDRKTLLQATYSRFKNAVAKNRIFLATADRYVISVKKQLPGLPQQNFSIEPAARDRAPAIGLAALIIHKREPQGCLLTAWSDHYIKDPALYLRSLQAAEKFLLSHPKSTLAIGVKPESAHTGYGYIRLGKAIQNRLGLKLFAARGFKEKPSATLAKKYLASGSYLWNTGCFLWQTQTLLELYGRHLPKIYNLLMKIEPFVGTARQQSAINKFYPQMPKVDLEAGLIEKLSGIVAVQGNFGWADIGDWAGLKNALAPGPSNLSLGPQVNLNSQDCVIYNYTNIPVATLGLRGQVLVVTKNAILAADKSQAQNIKQLLKLIHKQPKLNKPL